MSMFFCPLIISSFFTRKMSFFVYSQGNFKLVKFDKLVEPKKELTSLEDENKLLANKVKTYTASHSFYKIDAHIFVT